MSGLPAVCPGSTVLGGPLYQILRLANLSDDTTKIPNLRIIAITLLCWLPLLILSAIQGQFITGTSTVPFLADAEVHVRFLVVLPLMILAELVVHRRMRPPVALLLERDLIADADLPRFEAATGSAICLRNSVAVEVLLIAVVYAVGSLMIWRRYEALS